MANGTACLVVQYNIHNDTQSTFLSSRDEFLKIFAVTQTVRNGRTCGLVNSVPGWYVLAMTLDR